MSVHTQSQVAWTLENQGKWFKGCPIRDKDTKCRVYGFLDLELPSDYYKQLLYDLHEENKALKRMKKMSGVMEDSSKRMSINSNNQNVKDLKDDLIFVKSKLKVYDRLFTYELRKYTSLTYWKKLTRLQLYTKVDIERAYSTWRRRHKSFVTASGGPRDGARIIGDGVRVADSEETLRIFSS
ncbi:hypothetical protein Tco_0747177 [Tanacetum coccineum]